jgi:2-methylisocitrate lyase-like PEP mutase family enzyme
MKMRTPFSQLLKTHGSIVMPAAHDALTARLIEAAGFPALAISGSAMLATRYGLPDIGLAGLSDMALATRDLLSNTSLPCLADGDDGYGNVQSVARTVRQNEALGVGALVLEDQERSVKRPGQTPALAVVSEEEIGAKLKTAVSTRDNADFWIIGRTDLYARSGIDAAMSRADSFLKCGADGIFIAGVRKEEELVAVGRRFAGVPLTAVIYGAEGWPNLSVNELKGLGYTQIVYPLALILPACLAIGDALKAMQETIARGTAPARLEREDQARVLLANAVDSAGWERLAHDN